MESGKVKKQRSKVNRACDNCRRRKIKCTGKFPCSNCDAYQCQCVFSNGHISANGNLRISSADGGERPFPTSDDSAGVPNSVQSSNGVDSISSMVAQGITPSEPQYGSSALVPPDSTNVDLASLPLIELNPEQKGLYKNDIEFQKQALNLQHALKYLKAIPNPNEHVSEVINSINAQIDSLINDWEPEYDMEHRNFSKTGPEGIKSLETRLMMNKYTDQVALTGFAVWTDYSKVEKGNIAGSSFLLNQPLVDDVFGLYSPVQALSLRGIGHLFQGCIKMAKSSEKILQVKENLYLLLRFFDITIDHINQSCISIANPLESYLQRKNLLDLSSNTDLSVNRSSGANSKELIRILINRLPQPFLQNVTSVSTQQLLDTMYEDFYMFRLVLKMYDDHKKGFESLMIKITANSGTSVILAPKFSAADIQDFICYCEEEELLLALCYTYYNSTLYHFDEFSKSLEYFELLLSLLNQQLWLEEKYGFQKVLEVAISYAVSMGLSRWEFYVGLDEVTAERRRECWWKLYCREKQFIFHMGYLSSINDSKMNCLLPRVFRDAGFSDHRSFVSKVHLIGESTAFLNMTITDLAFYGECAVSQVISHFYSETLYSERFTSIKNTAKPPFVKFLLLEEILNDMDSLNLKLDAIKKQTIRLHRIAYSYDSSNDGSISKEDRALAIRQVLLQGCLFFCVSSAVNNLVTRLKFYPRQAHVQASQNRFNHIFHEEYTQMTKLLLSLDDDYTVSRAFTMYGYVYLMVVSGSFSGCHFEPTVEEVVMSLRLVRRVREISIYRENEDNEIVTNSMVYRDFRRLGSFVSVLTNSLLQSFMLHHDITKNELFKTLAKAAPDIADLPPLILNPKSELYKHLMGPVQESGVHLNVKRMLGKAQKLPNRKSGYPKTADQLISSNAGTLPKFDSFPLSQSDVPMPHNSMDCPKFAQASMKNLTSQTAIPINGFLNDDNPKSPTVLSGCEQNLQQDQMGPDPCFGGEDNSKFSLGTLDEFVHKGDLNDLYNTLWSDLYSDELGQSILAFNNNLTPRFDEGQNH